ncbi:hypothetical protein FIV42_08085 [Persicimonas caeni]|uniref:Uncharacterized protein n=1 Tax=Persicimonas caeni TaxID=2292766 RepID=A0A4Y6PRE5_PERCE|nr:hypothetical protein [Persicimonas caeni]QDG50689.1 hypothetical protein FIV42_08085 [Persicimonas caeni]QED31910.1 hypothetical protein FRD00_08080 [Persicimonas caeni]
MTVQQDRSGGSTMIGLVALVLVLAGCGEPQLTRHFTDAGRTADATLEPGDAGDADAADTISDDDWYDAQDEVVAPWVHEIDLETAKDATIEPDRVSWPLPEYDYMTEWEVRDIIWAPVSHASYAMARVILEIEQKETEIIFYTRDATLGEIYAKSREDAGN